MFLIILASDAHLWLVKLTSTQADIFNKESEDFFKDYMLENHNIDLYDSNINWAISLDDAIEIEVIGGLTFPEPKVEQKVNCTCITIE